MPALELGQPSRSGAGSSWAAPLPPSGSHGLDVELKVGDAEDDEPDDSQMETLSLNCKKGDNIFKIGLQQFDASKHFSGGIVEEHSAGLKAKLRELDHHLTKARRCWNFRSLQCLQDDFETSMAQLSDAIVKVDLHSKLIKNLLSTMRAG